MKKIFARNAGAIGLASTAAFAVVLVWYTPQTDVQVPVFVYAVGIVAIILMVISLWSSLQ